MHEHLFASFLLDAEKGLEIALKAENVSEATPINGTIRDLPAGIDYLEGIMTLREDIIPVINLKKRLGLENCRYEDTAKVAVVTMREHRFGLLFDDIREVFRADAEHVMPINALLQSDDKIIEAIITLNKGQRTVELLDLGHLFKGRSLDLLDSQTDRARQHAAPRQTTYSRWVVFSCLGQRYGVPVKYAKEIAFFSEIDDTFKTGHVEGAIQLRGNTIPVMRSRYLLSEEEDVDGGHEDNRVLVLASEDCSFGMIVDEIREIVTLADDDILTIPSGGSENLLGVYTQNDGSDILLLDMPNLVCNQIDDIKSLSRITQVNGQEDHGSNRVNRAHHLITENCYLIFSIHKHFAVELKDVQEIIESEAVMKIPRSTGHSRAVINLRGEIVPVVNARSFFGFPTGDQRESKLIICRGQSRIIALEVDAIVTIYKQEDYHSTPSLNPRLADKKDTLDRLIEYEKGDGLKEHVLVVNMHNLVRNHLEFREMDRQEPHETGNESEIIKN